MSRMRRQRSSSRTCSKMGPNSQMDRFNWTRYWYAGQSDLPLDDWGFLPDPSSRWGSIMYPNLVQLDALKDVPCLILLGEPGLGKSAVVQEHVTALRNNPGTQHGVLSYDLKDFGGELS